MTVHTSLFTMSPALAVLLLAGCGQNPTAVFTFSKSTLDLLPPAKNAVETALGDNFGTPNDLIAWDRLPVEYGGVRGTVAAAPEGQSLKANQIAVGITTAEGKVTAGEQLTWLTGQGAKSSQSAKIVEVSADGTLLTLDRDVQVAEGDEWAVDFGHQLQTGRMVYMKNCMHCHGVTGDGAGPTARYLNPLPRDFRLGVFKFTETHATERASREDLWRVIKDGIPGTYMPSFLLLKDDETKAVIEYVLWLSMRGEIEKRLGDEMADYSQTAVDDQFEKDRNSYEAAVASGEKPEKVPSRADAEKTTLEDLKDYLEVDFADSWDGTADFVADSWRRTAEPESKVVPAVARVADTPESRANGRLLYLSDRTKCYTCHGISGAGDGAAAEDFWPMPGSSEKYPERGLHDAWGHVVPPRNLLANQYRGGRRPVDVYRRIYAGIKGTPMPAFGGNVLKDEEIWDIVNYVMSLPYETSTRGATTKVAAKP